MQWMQRRRDPMIPAFAICCLLDLLKFVAPALELLQNKDGTLRITKKLERLFFFAIRMSNPEGEPCGKQHSTMIFSASTHNKTWAQSMVPISLGHPSENGKFQCLWREIGSPNPS